VVDTTVTGLSNEGHTYDLTEEQVDEVLEFLKTL
jgi:hypothetical protein